MQFDIKSRFSSQVLFSCELTAEIAGQSYGLQLGFAVKKAFEARAHLAGAHLADANLAGAKLAGAYLADANLADANLADANLAGAYLAGANLAGAYLAGAYLADAYLAGAHLADAYLADANLAGAYLAGAYLADAYLAGAYLAGAHLADAYLADAYLAGANGKKLVLVGKRPVLQMGPLGSRAAQLSAYLTDDGVYVRTGCFFGPLEGFRAAVRETHGAIGLHAEEYAAAIVMIEHHARLWTPAKVASEAA